MLEMLEYIIPLATCLAWAIAGAFLGARLAYRKHRRENAATAQCFECEWAYGAGTLSEAFRAVQEHTASEAHTARVVKAT